MDALSILTIFDFDDTLVKSHGSRVRIVHADGSKSDMSTEEYAKYVDQPGDIPDYSDFDRYPHGAIPIENSFREIKTAIEEGHDVVVLTARKSGDPVRDFLYDHGISGFKVVAVGSSNPMEKARFVIDKIKNSNFDLVQVYEDNMQNIRAIKKVVDDHGTRFRSVRVASDGSHITLESLRRRLFHSLVS